MPDDPFYQAVFWRRLRRAALQRDGYQCTVPGCTDRATFVDHIKSRRRGGSDTLDNLRSLCRRHDGEIKEMANGRRAQDGMFKGVDMDGRPIDPNHPWSKHPTR